MKISHLVKSTVLLGFLLGNSAVSNATDAIELDAVTVQSSTIDDRFESKEMEVSSTAVISGEEVDKYHAENIGNILNSIPGVTVRVNEGDSNKIHIRGIATEVYMGEKPGVAIVIDGVPVQERAGSVNIDSDNIESIKIIKGGASYLYGNDALAGAVIITTKRPKGKNKGLILTEQGSYGYEKYLARYLASTDNFALELQSSYKASEGYWENSDYWAKSFNGKFQYFIDDSSDITFGADKSTRFENDSGSITHTTYNQTTGVYTNNVVTNPTSIGEVGYSVGYDIDLGKYFLTYAKDFENSSNIMVQIYDFEDTTTNNSSTYDSEGDGVNDDHLYDSYAKTQQRGLKSEYRIDGDKLASMLGLDIARNKGNNNRKYRVEYTSRGVTHPIGEVTSDTTSNEDINAIYGELKYEFASKIVASLNARLDKIQYGYSNNLTSATWDKDFTEPSYKVGTIYKVKDNSILYSNISTGFRVPTLSQMYAGDMSTSTYSGTYTNNTDIDTEKTYNYEIGYRHKSDLISYEVSIFQLDRKDVIGRSSGNYASTKGVDVHYDNMADIQNRGLEFSLTSDKNKEIFIVLNYTYLNSKYTRYDEYNLILNEGGSFAGVDQNGDGDTKDDYVAGVYDLGGNKVPRISEHTIYLEATYRPIADLLVTAGINYRSSQYADEMNKIEVGGYYVLNLRTEYNTELLGCPLELFAKVDNVLDEQYYMMPRVTGDRNDDGVYDFRDMGLTVNPGRVYTTGVSLHF